MSAQNRRLKVIQAGTTHEHATGKYNSLKILPDTYELLGYVDDLDIMDTPRNSNVLHKTYETGKRFTMEEALALPDLDAVIVEVPNLELVKTGMLFAEKGIPMHLDKPAGENVEDYAALLNVCRKKNLPLQMGYMYRGNPALSFVREMIREKVVGEIFDASLDMNHGYGNASYHEYIAKFRGGLMFNLGCHLIDFVFSAMGEPEKITPFASSVPGHPESFRNNMLAVLEYPNAFVKITACSGDSAGTEHRRWIFAGTNGYIHVCPPERFDGKEVVVELSLKQDCKGIPQGKHLFRFPPQRDRYAPMLQEFAEIVRGEKKNPYTYEHDLSVHKATLAASGLIVWEK